MSDECDSQQSHASSIEQAISIVASWAQQERIVERVYFFGSRVRGSYQPNSDLDIAVKLTYPDVDTALAYWSFEVDAWMSRLSTILPWKPDLQLLAPDGTPAISAGVKESSILVYAQPNLSFQGTRHDKAALRALIQTSANSTQGDFYDNNSTES